MQNKLQVRAHLAHDTDNSPYVWVELLVDDTPLLNFQHNAVDLQLLVSSQYSPGDYFIITCTCGFPGCAGIDAPVVVTHDNTIIRWVVKSISPVKTYHFDPEQYRKAIERGIKAIRGWFTAYPEALSKNTSRVVVDYFRDLRLIPPIPLRAAKRRK
jgi:hypothetical protein